MYKKRTWRRRPYSFYGSYPTVRRKSYSSTRTIRANRPGLIEVAAMAVIKSLVTNVSVPERKRKVNSNMFARAIEHPRSEMNPLDIYEADYSDSNLGTSQEINDFHPDPRYKLKKSLLTNTEKKFLEVLSPLVGEEYHLMLQVQLSGIVEPIHSSFRYTNYPDFNRIKAKSIDFVLYDLNYEPIVAIELDDPSHTRPDRVLRDEFVDSTMRQVGLPLVRIPAAYSYNQEEIKRLIFSGDND